MKKFLIATCSVVALSGALGIFPAVSQEEGLSKNAKAHIEQLEKQLLQMKKAYYTKQEHADAEAKAKTEASELTTPLAAVIQKMLTPPAPVTEDSPMLSALGNVLPDDLKNNPFFKLATKSVGGWANESSQLTNKIEQAPNAFSALANIFTGSHGTSGDQMAKLICPIGEMVFGIPEKACHIGFVAMGSK